MEYRLGDGSVNRHVLDIDLDFEAGTLEHPGRVLIHFESQLDNSLGQSIPFLIDDPELGRLLARAFKAAFPEPAPEWKPSPWDAKRRP